VATIRALKLNAGIEKCDLGIENAEAVRKGCEN
jgi:formyltetrahydrofolate synthetase